MKNSTRTILVLALAAIVLTLAACQAAAPVPLTPLPPVSATAPQAIAPAAASPAAASSPEVARLDVQADPPGAQVSVDGQLAGTAPLTLTLPAGVHQMLISAGGYLTLSEPLTLTAGQEGIYSPALVDIAPPAVTLAVDPAQVEPGGTAAVRVHAGDNRAVAGVELFWNGQALGRAEGGDMTIDLQPSSVPGLDPGRAYTLTARALDEAGNAGEATASLTVLARESGAAAGAGAQPTPAPSAGAAAPTRSIAEAGAPRPASAGPDTVSYRVETIMIPTYPYTRYLRSATDANLGDYPLLVFDRQAYEAGKQQPVPVPYTLAILENRYLRVSILPELGGRIYEVVYKPTGNDELYKNPVIKPTSWGPAPPASPAGANWWPAAGGIEWGFPVAEHGYESAVPWGYDHTSGDDGSQTVTVFMRDYQRPYVAVAITMAPGSAAFTVHPTILNPTGAPFRFQWWDNALAAPGPANTVGQNLRFVIPGEQVTVHSTGDASLPPPGQPMSWPVYQDRDLSWLGNWHEYLGFFARPAAAAGFAALYDTAANEGLVRVFPPDIARGVKGFAMGFTQPLDPANWTDDGSSYAELHGGLAPTFDDWTELPPGGQVDWSETWYPAAGIGGLVYATEAGALNLSPTFGGLLVALQPTRPVTGRLYIRAGSGSAPITRDVDLAPGRPFVETVPGDPGPVTLSLTDAAGRPVITYTGTVR